MSTMSVARAPPEGKVIRCGFIRRPLLSRTWHFAEEGQLSISLQ